MKRVFLFRRMFLLILIVSFVSRIYAYKGFSMIKEINGIIYIGGMNRLSSYTFDKNHTLIKKYEKIYNWPAGIMNGSDAGYPFTSTVLPPNFSLGVSSLAFDNCLNWKQEHPNKTVRESAYDFHRFFFHTSSGDFETMNYTCMNSFIKSVEPLDEYKLWVCGTFGGFPKAFSVNKTDLSFMEFVDRNVMSCSRYVDEPMATYVDSVTKARYVASGWGLYRPDQRSPDSPDNNSTMLYANWRLYRNSFTLPTAFATVLSSDVNFIDVVKETMDHLYFFGHEINSQYGLNNQDDRNSWQSFMLRVCKNDLGFKYKLDDEISKMKYLAALYYPYINGGASDYFVYPGIGELIIKNLPTAHFVSAMKVNFGCYISKRPRAISDNHFWGETNVVYLNKLVDVVFDPTRNISFMTKNKDGIIGCQSVPHSQIPLLGLFNGPGIVGTGVEPTGALCQLQINQNMFVEEGSKRQIYSKNNIMDVNNAFEEIMAISSTSTQNFFEKTLLRTNGFTLYPYWNQGVMIGKPNSYKNHFQNIGKCQSKEFYQNLNLQRFRSIHNFSNTAWPNEITNRLTSLAQAMCQYYSAELLQFNASFLIPGVQFKRMFIIAQNITNYVMHKLKNETINDTVRRKFTSPLMVVGIVSTTGIFYRVVLCDFDSGIINHGYDKRDGSWYNWCIFRHTNQPYLYRQFTPMEDRERGESALYRGSSLLSEKIIVDPEDSKSYPINRDPQFHVVKDILRKDDFLHVVTTNNIHKVSLKVECSEYVQCIDCASDPTCMWTKSKGTCVTYMEEEYKDHLFVQDVLDRGFKCATLLPFVSNKHTNIKERKSIFQCHNYGFWRGIIIWKSGAKEIKDGNKDLMVHNNNLYVLGSEKYVLKNVSCYGIKDDHDKLYGAQEYDWTSTLPSQTYVLLNMYNIQEEDNKLIIIISITIPILIILILLSIIAYLVLSRKYKKKSTSNHSNQESMLLNENTVSTPLPSIKGANHVNNNQRL